MMAAGGLRERKKQRTKAAIQRAAMRLFKKRGYEQTTIEQIAAAADISPSTFFNYFPTKEDVVIYDEYDPQIFAALGSAPPGAPLSSSIRDLLEQLGATLDADRDIIYERAKLSLEVPELRARIWEELEKAQNLFAGLIASRSGRRADAFEVRVISIALVAAAFEASAEWVRRGGEGGILDLFDQAMQVSGMYARLDDLERKARPAS